MTFTYINEHKIDTELKCAICDEPFQSPMNCLQCGNTYCQKCIQNWIQRQNSCPACRAIGSEFSLVVSRVVLNQLDRLLVQCKLCEQTQIERSNFNDHLSKTCPKQIVSCTDRCGWTGTRDTLQEHLIKCRQRPLFRIPYFQDRVTLFVLFLAIVFFFIFRVLSK